MHASRHLRVPLLTLTAALSLVAASCGSSGSSAAAPSSSAEAGATTTGEPATTEAPITSAEATTTAPPTTEAAPEGPTLAEALTSGEPLAIAHAGGEYEAPHSTLYAHHQAVEAGADVLEMDVQLTADGVLVLHHDTTVDATTSGAGPVADFTLAEIKALDSAYWYTDMCWSCKDAAETEYIYRGVATGDVEPPEGFEPRHFQVATLGELVAEFPGFIYDIEVKGEEGDKPAVADALVAEVERLDIVDRTVVASFDSTIVERMRTAAPDLAASPGQDELIAWVAGSDPLPAGTILQVPPFFSGLPVVTPELIARAEAESIYVWAWMDDPSEQDTVEFYTSLLDLGVDGILAGRPTLLQEALAAR